MFCVAALILASIAFAQHAPKKTPPKTQALKQKLSTVKQKKAHVVSQLKQVKKQVYNTYAEVEQLDGKIGSIQDQLDSIKVKLQQAKIEQALLAKDLEIAHAKLLEKKAIAGRRIRSMYMSGSFSTLSVLIGAQSIADFASRKSLIERIAKRDHEVFDNVKTLRDAIATKKKRQDAIVNEVVALKAKRQIQEQDMKLAMSKKQSVLNSLRQERSDLQEELAAMEAESARIEAQIRAYQKVSGGTISPYKGRFMLPVNGRFSSGFGYRIHPISHVKKMHTGQDIAASSGTTIHAAGPGVVISTGWRGGYGNTVIIDHGGGISTLYGHCSKIYAHSGQKVKAGESIAAVGSTGFSTGPHLHFEVRVNGSPVNPRKYL